MTRRLGHRILVIEPEPPQQCDRCGVVDELRPYGPPGATMICFDCGMKDEAATDQRFRELMGWGENSSSVKPPEDSAT